MRKTVIGLALSALLFALSSSVKAQQPKKGAADRFFLVYSPV